MLNLIIGKDWTANRDEILRRISKDILNRQSNRILIVPELVSHDMERRLSARGGDTSSRYAEVLSFTRLARRVAEGIGSATEQSLDNGGRVIAMASACRQLHSRLKAYASVETKPEFLASLLDATDEFKRCCITPEALLDASRRTEGAFAQKLEELSLILEAYNTICQRGRRDPRDQMTWLLEQLENSDFAQTHCLYLDGFPDFTRQHMAILAHFIRCCPNVTVSINCDAPGSDRLAFEKAGQTAQELIRIAKKADIPVHIDRVIPGQTPLQSVRERLFQGNTEAVPALTGKLTMLRGESIHQECRYAARRVLELAQKGCRYRSIGIVCADFPGYKSTLQMVFRRMGIPLYLSGTEDILQKSVVATVLTALEIALGGFERQDVLRYLKSALSPVTPDQCDRMENYAILWGIQGSKWEQPWENHPKGLGAPWNDASYERLAELNRLRELAIMPLSQLKQAFRQTQCLADQVQALCAFFEQIRLAERLGKLADELDAQGDNRSAQVLGQLWEILISALEQMYDMLGETTWDGQTFLRLFTLLLSQYDVGTIPPVLDSVTAGPVTAMRCHQVDHLIVLGAQEGRLPCYSGSTGVLTDHERDALREMGVPLTGGSLEGLQAEFAEIYGVFCGASETVTVTCGNGQPSYVYRRLSALAGGEQPIREDALAVTDPRDAAAVLALWNCAAEAEKLGIGSEYQQIRSCVNYSLGNVSPENVRLLYGDTLRLSASQVDKQADCRFGYFLRYGLKAEERKEATVDPAEFGTYVHDVLEHTARDVMEKGGFHQVTLEETMEIAMAHSQSYAETRFGQLDSKRVTYLFQRNVQELAVIVRELWEELRIAEFAPVGFEVGFDNDQQMEAIQIPGGSMEAQLRGFVDRVDAWRKGDVTYFRVVDYKTGSKDFDYCDVFNGLGLQMLLYMYALERSGSGLLGANPVPAGVQYFPARAPVITSAGKLTDEEALETRGKEMKRRGLLLSDDRVLEAMEPAGSLGRLCCTRRKDGTLTGDIADGEQLRQLKAYIFRLLKGMVDDIASGKVDPNPYTRGSSHNACAYCPYKEVCHFACVEGRRNYKAMSAQKFWEEIGKERRTDG